MSVLPHAPAVERRTAVHRALRSMAIPRADLEMPTAALPSLRVARLRALGCEARGGSPDHRLSFSEMAFAGAPEAPAQREWVPISSLEHKKQ